MAYKVGISSGWWNIGKDPNLLGLGSKAGSFGATLGIQFNQVDLDTVLEFLEPDIKTYVDRVREKLNMELGLHGEIGEVAMFESAERIRWDQSHERLCITMKGASDLKFIYVNFHLSNTTWMSFHERELRPFGFTYQVVAPTGQPFGEWVDERIAQGDKGAAALKDWLKRHLIGGRVEQELRQTPRYRTEIGKLFHEEAKKAEQTAREALRKDERYKNLSDEQLENDVRNVVNAQRDDIENSTRRRMNEEKLFDIWKEAEIEKYEIEAGEIDAYIATAVYMIANRDPLWVNIVGEPYSNKPEDADRAYIEKQREFNAAVAAFYLYSHFTLRRSPGRIDHNKQYMGGQSVVEFCEKNKVKLLLECPQSGQGTEGIARLYHPLHAYHLLKKIGSSAVMQCIDFEQEMGQNIDLNVELPALPPDFGSQVFLLHLGDPIPYFGTAHIPIALADRGAGALYKWICLFRQKGFKDGYIIFERGSGRSPGNQQMSNIFEYSVYVLRQIVKYLDKDTRPDALPPEFYGLSLENKDIYAQQLVAMREHAWDPLQGLLRIPEEKHTFLGKAAVDAGKAKEWERGRYR